MGKSKKYLVRPLIFILVIASLLGLSIILARPAQIRIEVVNETNVHIDYICLEVSTEPEPIPIKSIKPGERLYFDFDVERTKNAVLLPIEVRAALLPVPRPPTNKLYPSVGAHWTRPIPISRFNPFNRLRRKVVTMTISEEFMRNQLRQPGYYPKSVY